MHAHLLVRVEVLAQHNALRERTRELIVAIQKSARWRQSIDWDAIAPAFERVLQELERGEVP